MRLKFSPKTIFNSLLAVGLVLMLWIGVSSSVYADVWGYVDEVGNTHFAPRQVDARYQLYFKTNNSSAQHYASPGIGHRPVVGRNALVFNPKADAAAGTKAQRLVALINQSSAYRLVSALLQREALRHAVDGDLIKAIVAAESGFNPSAESPVGALGLMQVMPDTASMLGLRGDSKQTVQQKLLDPKINVRLGTRYLRQLLDKFHGRIDLAVAAYNAGPGAVLKYNKAIPPYAETQNYVRTVLAIYQTLQPDQAIPVAHFTKSSTGASMGRRKRVTLAGSRTALALPPLPTIVLNPASDTSPSALDAVAGKITEADSVVAPMLGKDVHVLPSAQ